jgi:hypothetical protein
MPRPKPTKRRKPKLRVRLVTGPFVIPPLDEYTLTCQWVVRTRERPSDAEGITAAIDAARTWLVDVGLVVGPSLDRPGTIPVFSSCAVPLGPWASVDVGMRRLALGVAFVEHPHKTERTWVTKAHANLYSGDPIDGDVAKLTAGVRDFIGGGPWSRSSTNKLVRVVGKFERNAIAVGMERDTPIIPALATVDGLTITLNKRGVMISRRIVERRVAAYRLGWVTCWARQCAAQHCPICTRHTPEPGPCSSCKAGIEQLAPLAELHGIAPPTPG